MAMVGGVLNRGKGEKGQRVIAVFYINVGNCQIAKLIMKESLGPHRTPLRPHVHCEHMSKLTLETALLSDD